MGWIWGKKSEERSLSDSSRIKCRVLFISSDFLSSPLMGLSSC
jgi:hypothetical protein